MSDHPQLRDHRGDPQSARRSGPRCAAWVATVLTTALLAGCGLGDPGSSAPAKTERARAQVTITPAGTPSPTSVPSAGPTEPTSSPSTSTWPVGAAGTALAQLAALTVKGRAPMTGYDRERFGQAWLDADRNGCDTRNDVLGRDVQDKTFKPGTRDCVVLTGRLANPYTGRREAFARGDGDEVDIDHVVALGDAWATGAGRWDIARRAALANDPLNLLAVDAYDNRQKGDADAASWLPPAKDYRCAYVARQVAVKAKYALAVTPAEKAAVERVLRSCPGQSATPDPTHAPTRVDQDIHDPGPPHDPSPAPSSGAGASSRAPAPGGPVTYGSCADVERAGRAPIRRGDPGYSRSLDRDGDGVGCE